MIIQINRILWSAEFAGFQFDDVILTKSNEIAFRSKIRGKNSTITIKKLSSTLHHLLDELAQTNLIIIESDYQKFLRSTPQSFQTSTDQNEKKHPEDKKRVIYSAQWQDVQSFSQIIDELITISETHEFSEISIPETDPILAAQHPTIAAFLAVEKPLQPLPHPHSHTAATEIPEPPIKNPKPNGWLTDAAREFAIKQQLTKGVTVPDFVIQEFLDSLPEHQKTSFKSARTIFSNLKYKRKRKIPNK